jgi:hypothetical protein
VGDWHPVGLLAERVGGYCWLEHRLFSLTGEWATRRGDEGAQAPAEVTVFWATAARRHGDLAQTWRERLPVRAGVDQDELLVAPPGPVSEALELLAGEAGALARLGGLVQVVLPRLLATYEAHAAAAAPVSEGPVLAVLDRARLEGGAECRVGHTLWQRHSDGGGSPDVTRKLERMFEGVSGVSPGVWAS